MFGSKKHRKRIQAAGEPNLIPIMNLFVALIPFLLLTAAFEKLGSVSADLPVLSDSSKSDATAEAKSKKLELIFNLSTDKINVTGWNDRFSVPVESVNQSFGVTEIQQLEKWLSELKTKHPELGTSLFRAEGAVTYDLAMTWLSSIRRNPSLASVVLAAEAQ